MALRSLAHRGPPPALRAHLDISLSGSATDLSSLDSMSRQNPRRPTQPAGDNPAGRTRGFHFKIVTQLLSTHGETASTASSEPMALPSASPLGRSHPQVGATPSMAAGMQIQTASSSAAYNALLIGQGSVVPAASDLYAPGALPRTPIGL